MHCRALHGCVLLASLDAYFLCVILSMLCASGVVTAKRNLLHDHQKHSGIQTKKWGVTSESNLGL